MYNQAKCKIAERLTLPELKEDVLQIIHSEKAVSRQKASGTLRKEWRLKDTRYFFSRSESG